MKVLINATSVWVLLVSLWSLLFRKEMRGVYLLDEGGRGFADLDIEPAFRCTKCGQLRGWSEGCGDDQYEVCDLCWEDMESTEKATQ